MCVKESLVFFDNTPYAKSSRGSWLCIHIDNCEYTSIWDVFKNKKILQYVLTEIVCLSYRILIILILPIYLFCNHWIINIDICWRSPRKKLLQGATNGCQRGRLWQVPRNIWWLLVQLWGIDTTISRWLLSGGLCFWIFCTLENDNIYIQKSYSSMYFCICSLVTYVAVNWSFSQGKG